MRAAALYDIHGNLPALRAVLADVERTDVDSLVIGGDAAAGPLPAETVKELMALGERARFVRGNADREIVDAYDSGRTELAAESEPALRAAMFAAANISADQRAFLASFADHVTMELDGLGETLFCHGSPRSDTEIITARTPPQRLREVLGGVRQRVVVCGHTHQQFDRLIDCYRVINAGSVGVPYEGRAGAYWALLGSTVELRRSEYDLEAALPALRAGGFPDLEEMLKESLLDPVDPGWVADFFELKQAQADRS